MVAKTYAELKAEAATKLLESNRQNLASAYVMLTEEIEKCQLHIRNCAEMQHEIDAAAELDLPVDQIRTLYGRARAMLEF